MHRLLISLIFIVASTLGASLHPRGLIPRLNGKIVGGVPTTIESYPHQISLRFYGSHRCGGSIFKADIIITAAHCTVEINPINFYIVAGTSYRTQPGGIERKVRQIIEHEQFDPWQYHNDVSIMFLEEELEFSATIQPIPLASSGEKLKGGTMVRVTGWGTLESGGYAPEDLQVVYVSVVGNEECAKAYDDISPVSASMMCAGEEYGGKDSCQGDSGGPLICGGKQYGIVSWGYGCAFPKYPGVYADISHLREWINFKVKSAPFH